MKLFEFFDSDLAGYQNVADDHSQLDWGDSRKTKITLGEIDRLRQMMEVQAYEKAKDLKKIRMQYQPPAQ